MTLPGKLIDALKGISGFEKIAFEKLHSSGEQVTSIRINPSKILQYPEVHCLGGDSGEPIPWAANGFYLYERPSFTFDPLFHAGTYYVQEASSMFLEQVLKQTTDLSKPLRVLDLCAAPGGKSTHIQSLISKDSLLVSNETIRSRAKILEDNIIKWGAENVLVTSNDPKDFSILENYFDVIVVDAPCSGSGLFRRDPEAIGEWSENNVALCSQRQQRILADIWPALKEDGILIYSTCSYSEEEDEDICKWLEEQYSIRNIQLSIEKGWGITSSGGGYRFWPDKVKGEGFFLACFQKKEPGTASRNTPRAFPVRLEKNEIKIVEKWIVTEERFFLKHLNTVYAWPAALVNDMAFLLERLRVGYSGILIGELVRDKLVPAHSLAMSLATSPLVERTPLELPGAINYLQKKELGMIPSNKGWQMVTYKEHPLGWINALPNRINNYYPKAMRILKNN
ncbi:MAG: Fmu (Sun) domain protein [Chitinophagaceae bacterium]